MLENSTRARPHPLLAVLALCALVLGLLAGPLTTVAHAEGTASSVQTEASLGLDGRLAVKQTITFSGTAPAQVSQRFETRRDALGDRQYVTQVSDFTATAGGKAATPAVQTDGRFTTVTVPTNGATEVEIGYQVAGAVLTIEGGTALQWGILQGLSVSVEEFEATVAVPAAFSYVKCTAGAPNSDVPCNFAAGGMEDTQVPTFRDGPRGEQEVVSVDIGFAAGTLASNEVVEHQWTVGRAFSAAPLPLALALGLLVLGGVLLYLAHRRIGADASAGGQISKVGEFVPTGAGVSEFRVVGDVRPGHVGTVADERVDPIDVTASLVDLAVRGHLQITELPSDTEFSRTDWRLDRLVGSDTLRPFEVELLNGLAQTGGSVRVSELASRVHESIAPVQNALYDEVVANGWFERRPDSTRNRFTQVALIALILAVVATGLLAAFTTFGLVGLALVALALGWAFVAQEMPSRTAKGSAMLTGLGALRSDLLSQPTNQMPPGREQGEISQLLPYAIVLGGADRWLDAIVATDGDEDPDPTEMGWYHGPENWHLRDLPESLKNFITSVSGSLFAR